MKIRAISNGRMITLIKLVDFILTISVRKNILIIKIIENP